MSEIIEELKTLRKLLLLEKEEDFTQYKNMIQSLTLEEKKEKGLCWHPIEVVKTGYSIGDRAFVIVERNKAIQTPHQFKSGGIVNLVSHHPKVRNPEQSGVINFIKRNRMKIILNKSDLPEWIHKDNLAVEMLFDERTYIEMQKALDEVIKTKRTRLAELRDILLGHQEPAFHIFTNPIELPQLNASQNKAVNQVLAAKDVAIVHGPPGTGKTTTLVQTVKLIAQREATILVCAPSNAAVDLLTERLAKEGLRVVRIGNISRIDEDLVMHTLDGQLAHHPEMKNIKKVKKQAAELRRKGQRWKRSFSANDRKQRYELFKEAGELNGWANQLEQQLVEQILHGADVITATMVGVTGRYIDKMKFKTLVIDEAAQALEPATWIPILRASRVIFTGDPLQLPPTVKSIEAARKGFNITLMEKGIERIPQTTLLNTQYRMNEIIMGFSNMQFYGDKLKADEQVKDWTLEIDATANQAVEFIDTAGCGFDEQMNEEYKSRFNPDEFNILREHLYQLVRHFKDKELPSIGIISPYRQQVIYMRENIEEDSELAELKLDINTIDAFQGQERDVIYISLVRSNTKGEIGFLSDYRRMNVAMTRARKKLVIVGDSATLGRDAFYNDFMEYCELVEGYRTAWEFMA